MTPDDQDAIPSVVDMGVAILTATRDGDDLAPHDLKLIELGVNGYLNETGIEALRELYRRAMTGYVRPWLQDIEHLTIDHDGNVRWKGVVVENFTISYAYSEQGKGAAERLAARCRALEDAGVEPTAQLVLRSCCEDVAVIPADESVVSAPESPAPTHATRRRPSPRRQ